MSQADFGIMDPDSESGTELATHLTEFRDALHTQHSGDTRPSYAVAGLIWKCTATTPPTIFRFDGTNDVVMGYVDETGHIWMPVVGGGSTVLSSADTVDLGTAPGTHVFIGGTTTITSFGSTMKVGQIKTIQFTGGLTIKHDGTALNLPVGGDTVVSAGDRMIVVCLGPNSYTVLAHIAAGSSPVEPAGVVKEYSGIVLPAGYLWADGSMVSRSTFATLFAAISKQTTGSLVSGNATITSVASTTGIAAGMPMSGPGIQSGALVKSFTSNSITMTLAANGTGTAQPIVIAPHGVGDGITTFTLPNRCGRIGVGRDDMSGTARNNNQVVTTLTTTNGSATATVGDATNLAIGMYVSNANVPPNVTITDITGTTVTLSSGTGVVAGTSTTTRFAFVQDAQRLGATGGEIGHKASKRELVPHTHIATVFDPTHTHLQHSQTAYWIGGNGAYDGNASNDRGGPRGTQASVTGITVANDNTGEGFKSNNTPPEVVMNYIVKT